MNAPIFVLGSHRSGTSAVSGLLVEACGVSMGEQMPATSDNPLGYYEAQAVVDAHRDLLAQLERDWTCPPSSIDPAALDLSSLREQVEIHDRLPAPWAMKDPRSMFLLPAWSAVGVDEVRLVAVARPPVDTINSIVKRDGIREDRTEAIVEAYLQRLVQIAEQVPLTVIRFPGDDEPVTDQVRTLADGLGLPWDEDAAQSFFRETLVRNRAALTDTSPAYERLLELSAPPDAVEVTSLSSLTLDSDPPWRLETHLGPQHGARRRDLWALASFDAFTEPQVVELLPEGARRGGARPANVDVHQLMIPGLEAAGAALLDTGVRPHVVVAHGMLADRSVDDVEFLLRSIHLGTHPLAQLVLDVPGVAAEAAAARARPLPADRPSVEEVEEVAAGCGWDVVRTARLSGTRMGMVLRKRVPTEHELVPMVEELVARVHRISAIDDRLLALESRLTAGGATSPATSETSMVRTSRPAEARVRAAERRAATAERQLERLRNRRSVRLALGLAERFQPLFRTVRSWRRR